MMLLRELLHADILVENGTNKKAGSIRLMLILDVKNDSKK
jgi:hypothetical protein